MSSREADFYEACLGRAGLVDGDFTGAVFRKADLRAATLKGACADDANFDGADLSEANAAGAKFRHVQPAAWISLPRTSRARTSPVPI